MTGQIIDWAKVRALKEEVGEDGLAEVIDLFLEEVELVLAVLDREGRNLADDMHFLKGCAANLGFTDLVQLCVQNEKYAPRSEAAATAIQAVRRCYRESRMVFLSQIGAGLMSG